MLQELGKIVEASGGVELPFNAIPPLAGSKVLLRIAECEGLDLSAQHAKLVLENSAGDLLNAIETLQLYGQGKIDQDLLSQRGKKGKKVAVAFHWTNVRSCTPSFRPKPWTTFETWTSSNMCN